MGRFPLYVARKLPGDKDIVSILEAVSGVLPRQHCNVLLSKNNWSLLSLCFTLSLESVSFVSSSTSFWYQFLHFRLTYSFNSPIVSSSSDSSLCTFITSYLFHSRLKTYMFHKSYPRSFTSSSQTAFTDYCLDHFLWNTWFPYCFFSVEWARLSWPSRLFPRYYYLFPKI